MRRPVLASYLLGLLILSALIGFVAQMGEIERFLALARHIEPGWLALCAVLQFVTYFCESMAWQLVLRRLGFPFDIWRLLPLSIAKLFSDQAAPSAGISGMAFFLGALRRRNVPRIPALSCVLANIAAYFAAYAVLTALALALQMRDAVYPWLLAPGAVFIMLQTAIPLALWHAKRRRRLPGVALLARHPWLRVHASALQDAAARLPLRPALFVSMLAMHAGITILDAATLWAALRGLGQFPSFSPVFSSFVLASVAMSASPVPLGLGVFEASCVALLHGAGIGLEAGLTATLLLRGTTTWLPMLPGLWLIRREMQSWRLTTQP